LVADIYKETNQQERCKTIVELINQVVHGHFCSDVVYQSLKSNTRPKFLNIGLRFTALILQTAAKLETSSAIKEKLIEAVV